MQLKIQRLENFIGVDVNQATFTGLSLRNKGLEIKEYRKVGGRTFEIKYFIPESMMIDTSNPTEADRLAVLVKFEDVIEGGKLTKIEREVIYYNEDTTVGLSKIEYIIVNDEHGINVKRCKLAYDHLWNGSKGTPIEGNMNALLTHYSNECSIWLLGDPQVLIDAIIGEQDATIISYLDTIVDGVSKKARDAAMEQLTGIKWTSS